MVAQKVLFIGLVWPEPTSSAAGTRIIQLVRFFKERNFEVHFASAAQPSDFSFDLHSIGAETHQILLNHSSFNVWIKALQPEIVVFDRFMIEEQYGWRVQQECPETMRILDTEDLHFLRKAREVQQKAGVPFTDEALFSDEAKREIASILRCDLSLIISEEEIRILTEQFKINASILYYLPFLEEEITEDQTKNWNSFEEREGFAFIGNFMHEPNWQTVKTLKTEIWPELRKLLPKASMNIYGSYPPQKALQLNNKTERFFVHGRTDNAQNTLAKHRILLAPITFGAGIKGKFIDAMQTGTPNVTTSVGAESMHKDLPWGGFIENDWKEFCLKAVLLYNHKEEWLKAQQNGTLILNSLYRKTAFEDLFLTNIKEIYHSLPQHRQQNFMGEILKHQSLQSTRYMSLWIEEKNRKDY
ncbi:glycosyltransferase [Pedobacter montanisoli]|uniref:Glycosyltransferase n=1 Tax=Pedobacter montanisoli TaxID=2923277 RepID=A0ABS9ZW55_9SPHI|nr:glycosyltransferase [Pedobacter montanisoli]MCJ0742544.1 glycosyltransferase [Pedobacter montanisoli]